MGVVGVLGFEAVPWVFFPHQKEYGGGFLERVVVAFMVPPLFLADPSAMPGLGILRFLTEEEEEVLMLGATLFLGGVGVCTLEYNAVSSSMAEFIIRMRIRGHWVPVKM